jgi:hypothetical protein
MSVAVYADATAAIMQQQDAMPRINSFVLVASADQ